MRRLKILIWHIHGSYLDAITACPHDWYIPVRAGHYGGRRISSPPHVHNIPWEEVPNLDLDLVIYQSPKNIFEDRLDTLSPRQQHLPGIYIEHNTPKPSAVDSVHPVNDPGMLLVHVTHYNRLMWDNGETPTIVIEHSVSIDPAARYCGVLPRGITVCNGMQYRPRIAGYDLFLQARGQVPLDAVGIDTDRFGGLGDIKYYVLHRAIAPYRFLFSPMRYTSLPLAVIEGMTVGMPVIALATTEIPTVLQNGVHGYISCDPEELLDGMRHLLADPTAAKRMGDNARTLAEERFSLPRFTADWDRAFERAITLRAQCPPNPSGSQA